MESPKIRSAQKIGKKNCSQPPVPSTTRVVRSVSPQQSFKSYSSLKDEQKDRHGDKQYKVSQKPPKKENTKPLEMRLHTQQRAAKRDIFNYSVATKLYLMEQQKRQIEKLQKMIEEEEIRMLRKEMIPRAQLMPFFDRPFFPERSTRPVTVPREPRFQITSSKCSSRFSCYEYYHFQQYEAQ